MKNLFLLAALLLVSASQGDAAAGITVLLTVN